MATHSSVLAWRIPGTGEPGGLTRLTWRGGGGGAEPPDCLGGSLLF